MQLKKFDQSLAGDVVYAVKPKTNAGKIKINCLAAMGRREEERKRGY